MACSTPANAKTMAICGPERKVVGSVLVMTSGHLESFQATAPYIQHRRQSGRIRPLPPCWPTRWS
jgi:hypothetical protein